MSTEVSICNSALTSVGAEPITSLTDGTKAARICNIIYSSERDALLEEHRWNFAIKRVSLAQEDETPVSGYNYSYALPSDFLAVIDLGDTAGPYVIEEESLLTDDSEVYLQYVAKITEPAKWPETFCVALANRIAKKIAPKLKASISRTEQLQAEYEKSLSLAKSVDAASSGQPTPKRPTALINARSV